MIIYTFGAKKLTKTRNKQEKLSAQNALEHLCLSLPERSIVTRYKKVLSQHIPSIGHFDLFSESGGTHILSIIPGFAFPSLRKFFIADKINKKIQIAANFIDKAKNIKVEKVSPPIKGQIIYLNSKSLRYKTADFTITRDNITRNHNIIILQKTGKILIIGNENGHLDIECVRNLLNTIDTY